MQDKTIEQFGTFEVSFVASDSPANPYRDVTASATLQRPDGTTWTIPLFYDGENTWRLRISPDQIGEWSLVTSSSDAGLDAHEHAFQCVASSRQGGVQPMAGYPYHFQRQNGTPVWLMGDTHWRLFANDVENKLNRETVCHYIDVRAAQGFNYIHADIMGGAGINSYQTVFHSFEDEEIAPEFFQEVDFRVRYLNDRGITAGLVLAWHRGPIAWDGFPSEEAMLRYARYVAARYSAFDVIFIISGEWDQIKEERKPIFNRIGNEIMHNDPHNRMRGIHPCQRRTVEEFAGETWNSFGDYQQMYCAPHGREATPPERDALRTALLKTRVHQKPVLNTEYGYYLREMGGNNPGQNYKRHIQGVDKPHSHTRASFRRASWVLTMAGGYFVTGFGTTYFGGWRNIGPFDVDDPKNDDAERDLTHIKQFWDGIEWWKLEPQDDLVEGDIKPHEDGFCYCLAKKGETFVIYCEGVRAVRLSLEDNNTHGEAYRVQRYDPRCGEYETSPAALDGSGNLEIQTPDTQDWVFRVQKQG